MATSAPDVVDHLRSERGRYLGLTERQQAEALVALNVMPFELETFDFYRRMLRPGERFAFHFSLVENSDRFRSAFAIYGRWHLYPNVYVEDARAADVVLGLGRADPNELGLRVASIVRGPDDAYAARRRDD